MSGEFNAERDRLDALSARLREHLVREASEDMDLPHVLICEDPETGHTSFEGPYPDGLSALLAAEAQLTQMDLAGTGLVFRVAPLLAAQDL